MPNRQGYQLRSELAQLCLPAAHKDRNQTLAWVNSICLLYLFIGLVGIKPPLPVIKAVAPLELPVNIPVEAPPVPVTQTQDDQPEPQDQSTDVSDAPAIVAVTLDNPAVNFSVPTVGNVLVSASAAQAPPAKPMQVVQKVETKVIRITPGQGRDYPKPTYPQDAIRAGVESVIILLISVDAGGTITDVKVESSRGYGPLVNYTVNHVKKRFVFPATEAPLQYRVEFQYPKIG